MGLTSFLGLELTVPDPGELEAFWVRRGLTPTAAGVLGTADRSDQLRLREGPFRHVSLVRLGCRDAADLVAIAQRLDALGVASSVDDDVLRCHDPILDHEITVEAVPPDPLTEPEAVATNRPGRHDRLDVRAPASIDTLPQAPRRVGHVVFGTPDIPGSQTFFVDGLGFRLTDMVAGFAPFLRCSSDHHNLLLLPAPIPCLNHYALEMDGADAIGLAGSKVVAERPDAHVTGLGRHLVGANLFWYLLDPAGGMFELFADMDQIDDDDAWEANERRLDWEPTIASWNSTDVKPDFFLPTDIDALAAARDAAGR